MEENSGRREEEGYKAQVQGQADHIYLVLYMCFYLVVFLFALFLQSPSVCNTI